VIRGQDFWQRKNK